ncbi:MAG: glycoside hydrolase family 15 protein [Sedimentisphaerales bacterium]|nr:glycoside hydrolase family 15 protein [Sedimentisphaerales bacterium]
MDNLNYGVIGNCKSAALISDKGSIDWCCLPDFDSSSVFAKLLDEKIGGSFAVAPDDGYETTQQYLRRTNILVTTFRRGDDAFELIDFMPRYKTDSGTYHCPPDVIRYIRHLSGKPHVRIVYDPRPAYARNPVRTTVTDEFIKHCTTRGAYESVYLYSDLPLKKIAAGELVSIERDHFLLLSYNQKLVHPEIDWALLELERTKVYWMGWLARTTLVSEYREAVERSALVLKLLAYQETGAILAAVTTSLPETIGDVRNWDYRYCWIRDASMTISVLTKLGHYNVAKRFLQFVLDMVPFKDEKIQIMYGIHRQKILAERELDWLSGYENSRPVRAGNAAYRQKQNDIYGIVMDVIYQSLRVFGQTLNNKEELWTVVRSLARHVYNHWHNLDSGIWEFRTRRHHFTFSKILCWVAVDRAMRIAGFFGKTEDARYYAKLRDRIKADVLAKGRDPETGALTQFYGSRSLDSANLLAEHYGFLHATDSVYASTVNETYERLCVDGLTYRYLGRDDFGTPHSSFTVCTFWMIKALYRVGQKDLARELFEKTLTYSNHLGLFSEDIDIKTKRLLGNFPQGYSHLALIDTAMTLCETPDWFDQEDSFAT